MSRNSTLFPPSPFQPRAYPPIRAEVSAHPNFCTGRLTPYTLRYNGACEAGIGSLKTRTHHRAALDGRPGLWSSEDVEAARRMADEKHYPRRLRGHTAAEAWQARTPRPADERRRFRDVVAEHAQEIRKQRGHLLEEDLGRARQASIDRRAVSRALVELGYLSLLRSDITPHIKSV